MSNETTCTANGNGYCDICAKLIPKCETCVDETYEKVLKVCDGKCDVCKADMVSLIAPCDECADANSDGKCDRCLKDMSNAEPCEHEDILGAHVDEGEDGTCDKCGGEASEEITCTENTDGKCDKCGEDMPAEE